MVIASSKWLSNSGDDQKPAEVVVLSNSELEKTNTAVTNLLKPSLMSAPEVPQSSKAELITEASGGPLTEPSIIDNGNKNEKNSLSLEEQLKELVEREKPFQNISNAMESNKNKSDYAIKEESTFQDTLETVRISTGSSQNEEQNIGELENNNQAFSSLIDATFNNTTLADLEPDPSDTNVNHLNYEAAAAKEKLNTIKLNSSEDEDRSPNTNTNTMTVGSKSLNANFSQTIAMNNVNAMSNKPVNPVFALDSARTSVLTLATSNPANVNTCVINGDTITSSNGQAKIVLNCEQNSHPFQTRTILLTPNIECKVGRLIAKCKASESNAIFDCKVLSRNHAIIWYSSDGKFWVKDTKSSNGTFINDNKLGNEAAELHYGDIVKFGVDVLENSRKEVHGCIIASVKLYMPDGRQAVSIGSDSQRSQYSGESRISFDDLHRLNVYMQETSQREKALKSKLYNIQNLLDATRKNSSSCWESMISEDQLIHRIHSLEKKIQILEKNMPENSLKNEILKLIDDKNAYQHSAKEALRSVYLERCEAMQKLAKLESDFTSSENECQILRDQIKCSEDAFQDVSDRLRLLEKENNEYRSVMERQELEAKAEFEERIRELSAKLKQREEECEILHMRISELSEQKRSESCGDEDKLQKQAIANLDAIIADMDMGVDDDDDDDDDDIGPSLEKETNQHVKPGMYDHGNNAGYSGNEKQENFSEKTMNNQNASGQTTIMKWLKNSDINLKEGSIDIFNAICNNESDSSDEQESISPEEITGKGLNNSCSKVEKKLQNLEKYIKQLKNELKNDSVSNADVCNSINNFEHNSIQQFDEQHYPILLNKIVLKLQEAFKEIQDNFKKLRTAVNTEDTNNSTNNITKSNNNAMLPEINEVDDERYSDEDDEIDEDNEDEYEDNSEVEEGSIDNSEQYPKEKKEGDSNKDVAVFLAEIESLKMKLNKRDRDSQQMLEMLQIECEAHKAKVAELLKLTESLSSNQDISNESSSTELKLPTVIDDLSGDGVSSDSGVSNIDKTTETVSQTVNDASVNTSMVRTKEINTIATAAAFDQEMSDELEVMNNSVIQREEELIMYIESLERSQKENIQLRNDLLQMQQNSKAMYNAAFMRAIIPMGVAVVGVLAYFITTYF